MEYVIRAVRFVGDHGLEQIGVGFQITGCELADYSFFLCDDVGGQSCTAYGYNFDIALLDHMSLNDIVFESYDVGTAVRELVDQGCNGKGYDKGKHDTDDTDNGSVFQSVSTS